MTQNMRTTVDLPATIHRRVVELARKRGQSLSATGLLAALDAALAHELPDAVSLVPGNG